MELNETSRLVIRELLEKHTGQQITPEREWRIGTALAGLFRKYEIANVDHLVCLLTMPGREKLEKAVVEALLNNETYFFRDQAYFDLLKQRVLPGLKEARSDSRRIRIWSSGCSTGQEALSIAMIFADDVAAWADWTIEIVGTDVSASAVAAAKAGKYTQFEIQRGLGVAQMLSYFRENNGRWEADPALHRRVTFRQANLLSGPPTGNPFDLVLCRNVLLYFTPQTRERAFASLAKGTASDGWLMLGAGETSAGLTDAFAPADCGSSFYRKVAADTPIASRRARAA